MTASPWRGHHLGTRTVSYTERDAILYALAVGAPADALDLVYEERLRVLPTFALTLAQWAPDALGSLGAFDVTTAVHGAQHLSVRGELPRSGEVTMSAAVSEVWDKGSAAVFEVEVSAESFVATWSLFAPGCGGFGGERGPSRPAPDVSSGARRLEVRTDERQAAFYRLLGDLHAMHIDPAAARAAGTDRPFLHGLCTLATTTLALSSEIGAHPAELTELQARFAAPVFPGDRLEVTARPDGETGTRFTATAGERAALTGGLARFRSVRPTGPYPNAPRPTEHPHA